MPEEQFDIEPSGDEVLVAEGILDNLSGVDGGTLTEDILNEVT